MKHIEQLQLFSSLEQHSDTLNVIDKPERRLNDERKCLWW